MRQSGRNPQLALVAGRQVFSHPLTIGGRLRANVDHHIKHLTGYHPHQFALGLLHLVVQAAQHAARGLGMVVLHKVDIQASGCRKVAGVEALIKKAPRVAKHARLHQQDVGNGGRCCLHQYTFSVKSRSRYWP